MAELIADLRLQSNRRSIDLSRPQSDADLALSIFASEVVSQSDHEMALRLQTDTPTSSNINVRTLEEQAPIRTHALSGARSASR